MEFLEQVLEVALGGLKLAGCGGISAGAELSVTCCLCCEPMLSARTSVPDAQVLIK